MDAVFSFLFGTRTGFAILFAGGILLFASSCLCNGEAYP